MPTNPKRNITRNLMMWAKGTRKQEEKGCGLDNLHNQHEHALKINLKRYVYVSSFICLLSLSVVDLRKLNIKRALSHEALLL